MAAADFLDEKRREIGARIDELKPLVEEYTRLQAAAAALDGVTSAPAPPPSATAVDRRRSPARASAPGPAKARSATPGRRGRPKGSGTRSAEALAIVTANPGITIPAIAQKLGIKQNYLYRVLPGLAQDGRVVKDGRGWKTKDPA